MEKALKLEQDAYKVMVYAETGEWPLEKDENVIIDTSRLRLRLVPF
jgi:hypothetical protein